MLQSRGISDLLAAEKKAQELIEEARKRKFFFQFFFLFDFFHREIIGKNKRIKDAQNEAKAEIEQFKAERERRYKGLEQQVSDLSVLLYKFIFL
jgi:V-type H+-transporting ATPase subunit G